MGWQDSPAVPEWAKAPAVGANNLGKQLGGLGDAMQDIGMAPVAPNQDVVDSMGFWDKALAATGKGMLTTGKYMGELASHVPGLGFLKPDPKKMAEEEAVAKPLTEGTTAGWMGNTVGELAPTVPFGMLARAGVGALARATLPSAAAPLTPYLMGAVEQGTQSFLGARPGQRLEAGKAGVVLGTGTQALAQVGREVAAPIGERVEDMAINAGRRALRGGSDIMSGRTKPLAAEAVREAIESGGIRSFGTTPGALARLTDLTERAGKLKGDIVSRLEDIGFEGMEGQRIATPMRAEGTRLQGTTLGSPVPDMYRNLADELMTKVNGEGKLGLRQLEALKTDMQSKSNYTSIMSKAQNDAKKDIASRLRQASEDSISETLADGWTAKSGRLPMEAYTLGDTFVPAKRMYGNLEGARAEAERGAARMLQRHNSSMEERIAALAALGSGDVAGFAKAAGMGVVMPFFRQRLPSTMAVGGLALGDALQGVNSAPAWSSLGGYLGSALVPKTRSNLSPVVISPASNAGGDL